LNEKPSLVLETFFVLVISEDRRGPLRRHPKRTQANSELVVERKMGVVDSALSTDGLLA